MRQWVFASVVEGAPSQALLETKEQRDQVSCGMSKDFLEFWGIFPVQGQINTPHRY